MPKGALLHGHLDAMAPVKSLLNEALKYQDRLLVKADRPVAPHDLDDRHPDKPVELSFKYVPATQAPTGECNRSLMDLDYDGAYLPVRAVRNCFPGGMEAFDQFGECSI